MSTPISVRALDRNPLRIGSHKLSTTQDTVVDLDDAHVRRDLHHFIGRWTVSGGSSLAAPATLSSSTAGTPALQINENANASASTSTGGAVNINNSASTGAGLVVFSGQAAPSGRLIVARYSSATASQTALYGENAGTGHAIHGNQTAASPNSSGSAGNFTSTNSGASCVQVSGVESGRGSIKVTHQNPGPTATSDANASGISIDIQNGGQAGTAAQGIFVDSTTGGTTGPLLNLKNAGNQLWKFISDATFSIPSLVWGSAGIIDTIGTGAPTIAAPPGSTYRNISGGVGTTFYVKQTGTGTAGWAAIG